MTETTTENEPGMVRRQHYLTTVQLEALRKLSQRTGLCVSEHIRRAIDEYVAKEGEKK